MNFVIIVLLKYYDFFNMFSSAKVDKFFLHRFNDHKIFLMFNKKSNFNLIYDMSQDEFKILKKYLNNNLIKRFIRSNFFSTILFILFTRKPDEEFRLYVDHYVFNIIIIKNRYSLLLIQKTLSHIY